MKNRLLSSVAASMLMMVSASAAQADILTFDTFGSFSSASNTFGLTQENVLTPGAATGSTVFGLTNQTNTELDVHSLTNAILSVADANGQARFTGANGADIGTGGFEIFLANNLSFTSLAFNLVGSTGLVSISIREIDNSLSISQYAMGPGSNFFGALAINGQRIERVTVGGGLNISSLEQVRVGGVLGSVTATPEPATFALLGTGLLGLAAVGRRRRES